MNYITEEQIKNLSESQRMIFAVMCIREIQHHIKDKKALEALDVAERYANGEATREELDAAKSIAWDCWGASARLSHSIDVNEWDHKKYIPIWRNHNAIDAIHSCLSNKPEWAAGGSLRAHKTGVKGMFYVWEDRDILAAAEQKQLDILASIKGQSEYGQGS